MTLTIRLLGPPAIERDGRPAPPPRGRKAWALLAFLLLADRPPGRRQLAELLFGEAADPLGALRWTLAELRRALGAPGLFGGDPVAAALGPGVEVDLQALADQPADPAPLLGLGGELLEGMSVASSPAFESWLVVERHRVAAVVEARLRQAAMTLLASGRAEAAVAYASRALARNPLEEGNHELLVRSLAAAGDRAAALRQVAVGEDTLRRELGVEPSASLRDAAATPAGSPTGPPVSGRAAVASQLDAGRAAIAAGAVQAGLDSLRRAVADAAACGDPALQSQALVALGGALVHAVRGCDEEGAIALHEALQLAARAGDRATAVTAHRELGLHASDMGDYPAAFGYLEGSIELARRCGDQHQQAWSLALLARPHLLRDERSQAAAALAGSLQLVHEQRWVAFLPWPEALKGELDLRAGRVEAAGDQFEHAWSLACQLGDPCWESMAARGLGLLNATRGDRRTASAWLAEADARANRVADRYQWVRAYVLDAMAGFALDRGELDEARRPVASLASLAARGDLRELVVRAQLHRSRLGDPAALASARLLAAGIDNPALTPLLDGVPAGA